MGPARKIKKQNPAPDAPLELTPVEENVVGDFDASLENLRPEDIEPMKTTKKKSTKQSRRVLAIARKVILFASVAVFVGCAVWLVNNYIEKKQGEQMYNGRITGTSTDIQMVEEIAYQMGISVDSRTTTLMTAAYAIPFPAGYTYREILGFIASMYAGCFIITEEGKLRLVAIYELPPVTNYLIDSAGNWITFGGDRILV